MDCHRQEPGYPRRYDLYYRGETERTWKLLKKDLEDNFYTINSDTLPDGTYVVRVVASDQPRIRRIFA